MKHASKDQILDELKKSPIIQVACQKSGVSRATYYRWRKEDASFAESADQALNESTALMNDVAESQLIQAIKDRNMTAIIFWLKNRHSAYTTRVLVDATHRLSDEALTPDEQAVVDQALRLSGITKETGNEPQ